MYELSIFKGVKKRCQDTYLNCTRNVHHRLPFPGMGGTGQKEERMVPAGGDAGDGVRGGPWHVAAGPAPRCSFLIAITPSPRIQVETCGGHGRHAPPLPQPSSSWAFGRFAGIPAPTPPAETPFARTLFKWHVGEHLGASFRSADDH